jgi:iron complex outermembrane receptor protein
MNYELGLKSSLLDRRLVLNIDIYELREKGLQQSLLNPATGSGFIVGNVGNIKNQGLEFDAKFRVIEPLTLTATGYFNRARTYNYSAGPCATFPGTVANGSRPGTCSFDGLRPSYNPSVTFSIGSEWRQAISDRLEGFVNLSGSYQGKQFEDATLDYRSIQRPFALINARVGVETQDGNWNITLFGKNLTGEAYYVATATQPTAAFMSAGGVTAPSGFVGWYGAPRTYGIEASHRF